MAQSVLLLSASSTYQMPFALSVATVGSIQYTTTWYLPAWVLALKDGSSMESRVIRTQMFESGVYILYAI